MSNNEVIPEAAVEAAARAAAKDEDASNWHDESEYYRNGWRNRMQVGLEAAAPHMSRGPLVHAYAAAGFTACGLETGGAISRHDGYDGPAHRTTADDRLVTCEECK